MGCAYLQLLGQPFHTKIVVADIRVNSFFDLLRFYPGHVACLELESNAVLVLRKYSEPMRLKSHNGFNAKLASFCGLFAHRYAQWYKYKRRS